MKYGPETDIVCHKNGRPLYTLQDGTQTFFSTRARAQTPLSLPHAVNGVSKSEWKDEDIVTVCSRADYTKNGRKKGWLKKQARKQGVTIGGTSHE